MYVVAAKVSRKTKEELLDAELMLLHRINTFIHFNMIEVDKNAKEYWKNGIGKLSKIEDLSECHIVNIVRGYGVRNLLLKGQDRILARYLEIKSQK